MTKENCDGGPVTLEAILLPQALSHHFEAEGGPVFLMLSSTTPVLELIKACL